ESSMSNGFELRQAIALGMLYGMRAWVAYWAIETSLITSIRRLFFPHTAAPLEPGFVGLLLLIYLGVGALAGAIGGAVISAVRPVARRAWPAGTAVLSVLVAFAVFTRQFIGVWQGIVLGVLTLLCLVSIRSGGLSSRFSALLLNPWVCSLLLIGTCLVQI